jgi:ubiquinone/menaquinone biosynthesis C-methylase UbiE
MATVPKDDTFRNYSGEQAAAYAKVRSMAYPVALINAILEHHRATGGDTGVLVDVGCGPGNATRDLAPFFNVVYGADPGEAMIKTATELGGTTATGAPIKFTLCSAEELDHLPEVERGSVDMISAAVCVSSRPLTPSWID